MDSIIILFLDIRDRVVLLIQSIIGQFSFSAISKEIGLIDIIEILIIAVCLYYIFMWVKNTKAWMLLKGILVIILFIVVASIFQMTTILYLAMVSVNVLAVATVVVFQPEIRRALENIGQKNLLSTIVTFDRKEDARFSVETVKSLVEACSSMSKAKTGALIVLEHKVWLSEYEATGILMDCIVSYQVLLNIFEHNTPLHDGAIIIRGDRIVSATCYLPLSDNTNLSKDLGTRHRAAVGISEVSDALVIVVSEETGNISIALNGDLYVNFNKAELETRLEAIRIDLEQEEKATPFSRWLMKGGSKHEKNERNSGS